MRLLKEKLNILMHFILPQSGKLICLAKNRIFYFYVCMYVCLEGSPEQTQLGGSQK